VSTDQTRKILRRQTWSRRYNLFAVALNAGLFIWNVVAGDWIALLSAVVLAALAVTLVFQTRQIRNLREQLRPRPDYAAIARMERDVWGETFGHAGAPPEPLGIRATPRRVVRLCGHPGYSVKDDRCVRCEAEHRKKTLRTARADQIMELRRAGHSQKEIAEQLGLAPQTIRRYLMGEQK
jgi:hypothetical protein